ncbi:hypothetical protein [Nitrincola sp.]|uniref:hypothetical protein n=1 Tax=Nitrincola sp. TaxID=1926584 RepID=UPI003A926A96
MCDITHQLTRLLAELGGNRYLRVDFLTHPVLIKNRIQAGFRISGADGFITRDTTDTGRAGGTGGATVVANSRTTAGRADANTGTAGIVAGAVV